MDKGMFIGSKEVGYETPKLGTDINIKNLKKQTD